MEKREIALIDTGIVYALSDTDDAWHNRVKDFLDNNDDTLVLPSTVIPESCYLLNNYIGKKAEEKFINALMQGELRIEHFNRDDLKRIVELLKVYSDVNIGFVDASIITIAERLKVSRILTTDRRHFSIIKPMHCKAFTLLP